VLVGDCARSIDLWAVGAGRNPLFLGRYHGRVLRAPPVMLGSFRSGQELYLWHEITDPVSGGRASVDIKDPRAYRVELDPRGGYRVELRSMEPVDDADRPLLSLWIYPVRTAVSIARGDPGAAAAGLRPSSGSAASMVVAAGGDRRGSGAAPSRDVASGAGRASPVASSPSAGRWPVTEALLAILIVMMYRQSRSAAGTAAALAGGGTAIAGDAGDAADDEAVRESVPFRPPPLARAVPLAIAAAPAPDEVGAGSTAEGSVEPGAAGSDADPGPCSGGLAASGAADPAPVSPVVPVSAAAPGPAPGARPEGAPAPSAPPGPTDGAGSPVAGGDPGAGAARDAIAGSPHPVASPVRSAMEALTPGASPPDPEAALAGPRGGAPPVHMHARAPEGWAPLWPDPGSGAVSVAAQAAATSTAETPAASGADRGSPSHDPSPAATRCVPSHEPSHGAAPATDTAAAIRESEPTVPAARATEDAAPPVAGGLAPPAPPAAVPPEARDPVVAWIAGGEAPGDARVLARLGATSPILAAVGRGHEGGPSDGTVPPPEPAPMPGTLVSMLVRSLAGQYADLREIHTDAEAALLAAVDVRTGRPITIVALSPLLARDRTTACQFVREAAEYAAFSHPSVLRIHDVKTDPTPHLVAEPLPGPLVSRRLAERAVLPLHEVLAIGRNLADALDVLHQKGVIHADVRPSRVCGGFSTGCRLLPPVLSHIPVERIRTLGAQAAERAAYRTPESAGSPWADYRGDVYAMGLLVHHMLSGRLPGGPLGLDGVAGEPEALPGASAAARHAASGGGDANGDRPERGLSPSVPPALRNLVRRCLHADPRRRYQDCGIARQLLDDLFAQYASRERIVMSCLPALARLVRTGLRPLQPILGLARGLQAGGPPGELFAEAHAQAMREAIAGSGGALSAIAFLVERAPCLDPWDDEERLQGLLGALPRLGLELAGLLVLAEGAARPVGPTGARQALREIAGLSAEVDRVVTSVLALIESRLVDYSVLLSDVMAGLSGGPRVSLKRVPASLRSLHADPAVVRAELGATFAGLIHLAARSGARHVRVQGEYRETFRRLALSFVHDGEEPLASEERHLQSVCAADDPRTAPAAAPPRAFLSLERIRTTVEKLGGQLELLTRTDGPGGEVRIVLPTNLT
jgi:hypothetical protein